MSLYVFLVVKHRHSSLGDTPEAGQELSGSQRSRIFSKKPHVAFGGDPTTGGGMELGKEL